MTSATPALLVVSPGVFTTVQDLGRPGYANLGVSPSGAADRSSLRRANRLVGNPESAAALELTLGGLVVRTRGDLTIAVTGAVAPLRIAGHPVPANAPLEPAEWAEVRIGRPRSGLRSYLAVRGGLDVPLTLGSRSADSLSGLGPPPVSAGDELPVGSPPDLPRAWVAGPVAPVGGELIELRVLPGPRADWFVAGAEETLTQVPYVVTLDSNRVGMKLSGERLERARHDELPSEGVVRGAVQVPPSGQPVLFLSDHPVTGGYPVIAVVVDEDTDAAAQARPGNRLRFRPLR